LVELLDGYGDHLEVVFKYEDYGYANPHAVWYDVDGEPSAHHEALVIDLTVVPEPK
jgi:hypothetical protein